MVERLRQRSAKPVSVGSTPTHASIFLLRTEKKTEKNFRRLDNSAVWCILSSLLHLQQLKKINIQEIGAISGGEK